MSAGADGPSRSYHRGTQLFVQAIGAVQMLAFGSFWVQLEGLVGSHGLFPARRNMELAAAQGFGFWDAPSVAWWSASDTVLHSICAAGVLCGALAAARIAAPLTLTLAGALYLSLFPIADRFFGYQWDTLLIDATWVAVACSSWSSQRQAQRIARAAACFLSFRLVFVSGLVKLSSGDPTWRSLEALEYHFWTQPLPGPLAPAGDLLPEPILAALCLLVLALELVAPFLLFIPGRARRIGVSLLLALQAGIALTGNYGFFNLLCAALLLPLIDDAWFRFTLEAQPSAYEPTYAERMRQSARGVVLALSSILLGAIPVWGAIAGWRHLPSAVHDLYSATRPARLGNAYGLFAVMTTDRIELTFEGTLDGEHWWAYSLPYRPDDLGRGPTQVAPHMPRLDWGLWFAALGHPDHEPLVGAVENALLDANPHVLALFEHDPFHGRAPQAVRVRRWRYRFDHHTPSKWWRRSQVPVTTN